MYMSGCPSTVVIILMNGQFGRCVAKAAWLNASHTNGDGVPVKTE